MSLVRLPIPPHRHPDYQRVTRFETGFGRGLSTAFAVTRLDSARSSSAFSQRAYFYLKAPERRKHTIGNLSRRTQGDPGVLRSLPDPLAFAEGQRAIKPASLPRRRANLLVRTKARTVTQHPGFRWPIRQYHTAADRNVRPPDRTAMRAFHQKNLHFNLFKYILFELMIIAGP